jgi:predicted kinase
VTNTATLIATIGPPGAGKSTWCRRHAPRGSTVVNLDKNRALVAWCHCPANQEATPWAVELGVVAARAVLARGGTVVWDATSAERASRGALQVLAAEHGGRTVAVLILPPLVVSLARNESRDPGDGLRHPAGSAPHHDRRGLARGAALVAQALVKPG